MGQGASTEEFRLLLIGKTGHGKSSLGNAILGKQAFKSSCGWEGKTDKCDLGRATRDKIKLEVVDTPGFCDKHRSDESIHKSIAQCLTTTSPGPHAVLVVMSAKERYSKDIVNAYREAKKLIDKQDLASRIILVFTGGDSIKQDNIDFEAQIQQEIAELREMMEDAKMRYVLFNNKATLTGLENRKQLEALLQKVREACMPDFTYLSSKLQRDIETIIINESQEIARNKNIPVEEARFQVRQAIAQADEKDEALKKAISHVMEAINTHKVDVHVSLCAIL
ncbi:uncharacterized protein [Littorina saxatilis]|uniref:AIG1-type G domain-containing protein n=1 Tax=Littorina saxatilis TaxID=31220 RepID=A0AAN9B7S1_9CAEN